jgi:hypothetical protein
MTKKQKSGIVVHGPAGFETKLKKYGVAVEDLLKNPKNLGFVALHLAKTHDVGGEKWGYHPAVSSSDAIKSVAILLTLKQFEELEHILGSWCYDAPVYQLTAEQLKDGFPPQWLADGAEKAVSIALKALKPIDPKFVAGYTQKIYVPEFADPEKKT